MGELVAGSEDITLLDMEASIEHLSRGTVRHADVLLVVVEPYYRSLETAARMAPLARELGINQVYMVGNKVRTPRDEAAVAEFSRRHGVELIAILPFDESVIEADRAGAAVVDVDPDALAVIAIRQLAANLEQRVGDGSRDH